MADKIIENNQVSMMGKIAAGFTFSHQVFGEGFYMTELLVKRLSDSETVYPVTATSWMGMMQLSRDRQICFVIYVRQQMKLI